MLFRKTINNYIKRLEFDYEYNMKRRKERFIMLMQLNAPKEILVKEIDLLRQTFFQFCLSRFKHFLKLRLGFFNENLLLDDPNQV